MTARERVLAALDHHEPDRVPVDLGGTMVSTLTRLAYQALRGHLELPEDLEPDISNRNMDSVCPSVDMLGHCGVDCRGLHGVGVGFFGALPRQREDEYEDEYGVVWRRASHYYEVVQRPLPDSGKEALREAKWADPLDRRRVAGLRERATCWRERSEHAIVLDIMCSGPFEQACKLRGHDKFLLDLYADRSYAESLLDRITDTDIQLWQLYLDEVGDLVDVVAQGDDVGMQTALFLSPAMYREIIMPRHRRLADFIHSRTRAKLFMHSCGSVRDIIPDLIEIGVDILNPVQTGATGMDLARLKREFGRDIVFWGGGIDTQLRLPSMSVEDIAREVRSNVEIMAPGGGYVFAPTHNFQADVPAEKIDAVYAALRDS